MCRWQTAWAQGSSPQRPLFRPELLADPRCAILSCRRDGDLAGGIIAYAAAGVTGISNLFGAGLPAGQLWASALQAVAAFRPDLPIVGYEHGTSLAAARQAGCQLLGRLRVWTRNLLIPVRRTVSAQALVVVWLGSLAPADAGFFIAVFRQDRLVIRVRWHVSIISPPSRQPHVSPQAQVPPPHAPAAASVGTPDSGS